MIRDTFFHGDYWVAYEHVQRFWRWFLIRLDDTGYPYRFRVSGIMLYPREYFIDAHKPGHMQFFHHFVESMKAYDEREKIQRARKSDPAYRNLTLIGLDEQTDKQQPMPDITIPVDEVLNGPEEEQLASEDNIDFVPVSRTEGPLLSEETAAPPLVTNPPNKSPPSPSSPITLTAWIIFGFVAIAAVILAIFLLLSQRE